MTTGFSGFFKGIFAYEGYARPGGRNITKGQKQDKLIRSQTFHLVKRGNLENKNASEGVNIFSHFSISLYLTVKR